MALITAQAKLYQGVYASVVDKILEPTSITSSVAVICNATRLIRFDANIDTNAGISFTSGFATLGGTVDVDIESSLVCQFPTFIRIDVDKLQLPEGTDVVLQLEEGFVYEGDYPESLRNPMPKNDNLISFRTPKRFYSQLLSSQYSVTAVTGFRRFADAAMSSAAGFTFKIRYNPGNFASLFVEDFAITPIAVKTARGVAAFSSQFNRVINNIRVRYHDSAMTNSFTFSQPSEQGRIRFGQTNLTAPVTFYLDPTFTFRPSPSLTAVSTIVGTPYVDWVSAANLTAESNIVLNPIALWYGEADIQSQSSVNYNIELIRPFESVQTASTNASCQINYVTSSVTMNATVSSSMSITGDVPFIAKINVTANETITLTPRGTVNATVEWGDGVIETWTTATNKSHTYSGSQPTGVVTVSITGSLTNLGDVDDRWLLTKTLGANEGILTLGEIGLTEVAYMCLSGNIVPTKLPTSLTSLFAAFAFRASGSNTAGLTFPSSLRTTVSNWNTSNITSMENCFFSAGNSNNSSINEDLDNQMWYNWDTSNVTNMRGMFNSTEWVGDNTSYATFENWDVSSVTDMAYMFYDASGFGFVNGCEDSLANWDVSSVTTMELMFGGTDSNDTGGNGGSDARVRDVALWDVSNVTNFAGMFLNAEEIRMEDGITNSYFKNIGSWNTSSATRMDSMFYRARFNRDIGSWNTSNVTNMGYMFFNSSPVSLEFNKDIGNWNVGNVTNMTSMFQGNGSFNQDLTGWCVDNIATEPSNFGGAFGWTTKPVWGTCPP
jgi:surface protein